MRKILSNQSGGTLVLFAVMLSLLITTVAVVIDIGRLYTIQAKAQNASDAALLGAVATLNSDPNDPNYLSKEMVRLFKANYPANYMGSSLLSITASPLPGVEGGYGANVRMSVPATIMGQLSRNFTTINIISQVTRDPTRSLEFTMVLDNTQSMAGSKITSLKSASRALINILFGDEEMLPNVHISIVPYDVTVHVGPNHESWVQAPYLSRYMNLAQRGQGFLSNRNSDAPANSYNDITDAPPSIDEATKFRMPRTVSSTSQCTTDPLDNPSMLKPMRFALNSKAELNSAINAMAAAGCTRINVGLMWGWFTLSPRWAALFDPAKPEFPAASSEDIDKVMVLMTDGRNSVFPAASGVPSDDTTTARLCEAIKAQGITIYTVGFGVGTELNGTMLRNCASQPSYYFEAPTDADLRAAFMHIGDDLAAGLIRLSK